MLWRFPTNSLIHAKKSDPVIKKREKERWTWVRMSRRYHVCIHNGWLMHLIKIFSLSWSSYISFVIKHCHSISTYVLAAIIYSMVRKIFLQHVEIYFDTFHCVISLDIFFWNFHTARLLFILGNYPIQQNIAE